MKPATCHPDRPHIARGLCNACYLRAKRRALITAFRRDVPTLRSIAAQLGISAPTVAKARREGRLTLANGVWRFTPATIGRPRKA